VESLAQIALILARIHQLDVKEKTSNLSGLRAMHPLCFFVVFKHLFSSGDELKLVKGYFQDNILVKNILNDEGTLCNIDQRVATLKELCLLGFE
jgi:hypothetical protein